MDNGFRRNRKIERFKMNCKVFQKWVNIIVFPEDIKLIDAIEVIQKYIEMEANNEKEIKRA